VRELLSVLGGQKAVHAQNSGVHENLFGHTASEVSVDGSEREAQRLNNGHLILLP
jgi:hypothetical protein